MYSIQILCKLIYIPTTTEGQEEQLCCYLFNPVLKIWQDACSRAHAVFAAQVNKLKSHKMARYHRRIGRLAGVCLALTHIS